MSLIRRWLKAGILEDGELTANEKGTPQGGSISVLLSNLYLHHVLDLWFEKVVKPRLKGQAYLIRYIDDFVMCFQYREDAERVQAVLGKRLDKFALALEPSKTKLIEFGRFAQRDARAQGRRPETLYFLGFTHFCTRNRKGNFKVGRKTEKSRLRRSLANITALMRDIPIGRCATKGNGSIRSCVAIMPTTVWRGTCDPCSSSTAPWNATGTRCLARVAGLLRVHGRSSIT